MEHRDGRLVSIQRRDLLKLGMSGVLPLSFATLLMQQGCTKKHVEIMVNALAELPNLINDHREQNGLSRIPISNALTAVAFAHIRDLSTYRPEQACGAAGNLHSWSDNGNWQGVNGNGNWKGCCFPDDFSNAACMWQKPMEITGYPEYGYEIAATANSAQGALDQWRKSKQHNDVISNQGIWTAYKWKGIGALYGGGYACAWFGVA